MHASVLRYIDQVARLGSIRRAASVLNVASSAVNRQILKLEAEIGTPLFERAGNGVRPTPAGDFVIRHARETLARWQTVTSEVTALSGDLHGEVRILAIPASIVQIIPRAVSILCKAHPNISFGIVEASPKEVAEEMRARRPDLAIVFIDRRHGGYEVLSQLPLRLGAVMKPDHPLAGRRELTLTECAAYPVVMLSDPWLLNATAETEFTHSGAQFRSTVLTNSLQMTKEIMHAGIGIGFFTPVGFMRELQSGELVHIPLQEPGLRQSEVGLLIHRERQNWPTVRTVAAHLMTEFATVATEIREIAAAAERRKAAAVR
ncbi:MAG: LysR family transcriptional regulator [Aquamicrobium sp.]|uniref:LysR family transcriptional regulator n=1 Tax=Aquamicrobium sp. TaxID=1872579 RepID=UPI00349EAFF2|nr:LysR family transcriptional regulator [Aquamicrobium sp.]